MQCSLVLRRRREPKNSIPFARQCRIFWSVSKGAQKTSLKVSQLCLVAIRDNDDNDVDNNKNDEYRNPRSDPEAFIHSCLHFYSFFPSCHHLFRFFSVSGFGGIYSGRSNKSGWAWFIVNAQAKTSYYILRRTTPPRDMKTLLYSGISHVRRESIACAKKRKGIKMSQNSVSFYIIVIIGIEQKKGRKKLEGNCFAFCTLTLFAFTYLRHEAWFFVQYYMIWRRCSLRNSSSCFAAALRKKIFCRRVEK